MVDILSRSSTNTIHLSIVYGDIHIKFAFRYEGDAQIILISAEVHRHFPRSLIAPMSFSTPASTITKLKSFDYQRAQGDYYIYKIHRNSH